ncbi:hypothetical protein K502DRAFT_367415 [Neoconidiobolus thromboides FSU 785]|nr:hypothetical protein K502DRAFT_367415 [Neoconidiobolus thromboides FSU 785]
MKRTVEVSELLQLSHNNFKKFMVVINDSLKNKGKDIMERGKIIMSINAKWKHSKAVKDMLQNQTKITEDKEDVDIFDQIKQQLNKQKKEKMKKSDKLKILENKMKDDNLEEVRKDIYDEACSSKHQVLLKKSTLINDINEDEKMDKLIEEKMDKLIEEKIDKLIGEKIDKLIGRKKESNNASNSINIKNRDKSVTLTKQNIKSILRSEHIDSLKENPTQIENSYQQGLKDSSSYASEWATNWEATEEFDIKRITIKDKNLQNEHTFNNEIETIKRYNPKRYLEHKKSKLLDLNYNDVDLNVNQPISPGRTILSLHHNNKRTLEVEKETDERLEKQHSKRRLDRSVIRDAPLAQLAERGANNAKVIGSSPIRSITRR